MNDDENARQDDDQQSKQQSKQGTTFWRGKAKRIALSWGRESRAGALGLAVFRAKLAVTWGGYEGNLGGISGSGGAGTGAGMRSGEQIHGGQNGTAGGNGARTRGASGALW